NWRARHATGEFPRSFLIGFRDPRGVHTEGGRATASVSQAPCDGPYVHAGGNEFGRRVVPKLVQVHLPAEGCAHAPVALRHAAWFQPRLVIDVAGEDAAVGVEDHANASGFFFAVLSVDAEQGDGLRIERDPPLLVGLGVLLPRVPVFLGDAGADGHARVVEIEVVPTQR